MVSKHGQGFNHFQNPSIPTVVFGVIAGRQRAIAGRQRVKDNNITVVSKYKRERVTKLLFATVGQCKVIACAVFPSASP